MPGDLNLYRVAQKSCLTYVSPYVSKRNSGNKVRRISLLLLVAGLTRSIAIASVRVTGQILSDADPVAEMFEMTGMDPLLVKSAAKRICGVPSHLAATADFAKLRSRACLALWISAATRCTSPGFAAR